MKKILFVDDEPEVLRALKRMLRSKRDEWSTSYAESAAEALKILKNETHDVIVSDSRMPVMDGAALLEAVKKFFPSTVRIILSGHSDQDKVMGTVKAAHQYLAKPIDQKDLFDVLARSLALGEILSEKALTDFIAGLGSLPALPQVYARLVEAIESDEVSLEEIGAIIEEDLGMSATILKLVNSAFFGIPRKIQKPSQAASLLGLDIIKSLVLSYQLFSTFDLKRLKNFSFDQLWHHSVNTAALSKVIAQDMGLNRTMTDEVFVAAMLHDIGKLLFGAMICDKFNTILEQARASGAALHQAEIAALGTSHAEAGAYLMGLWGMPQNVILAIAYHHRPSKVQAANVETVTAVHAANVLEHELVPVNDGFAVSEFDMPYLERVGLAGSLPAWRGMCERQLKLGVQDG